MVSDFKENETFSVISNTVSKCPYVFTCKFAWFLYCKTKTIKEVQFSLNIGKRWNSAIYVFGLHKHGFEPYSWTWEGKQQSSLQFAMFAGTKHLIINIMVAMRKFATLVALSFGDVWKSIKYRWKFSVIVSMPKLELVNLIPIQDHFVGKFLFLREKFKLLFS